MSFLNKPAPPGYVAGIGRGATGFTTRSDIGPARGADDAPDKADSWKAKGGQAAKRAEKEEEDLNDSNYDHFSGYGGSLFANNEYDKDDEEADRIYAAVDARMDGRRKEAREKREREETERLRRERPKLQQQFADVKRGLADLSEEDWANIPDIGDLRVKKQKRETFTAVPDSVLSSQLQQGAMDTQISPHEQLMKGWATPVMAGGAADLTKIGEARKSMLNVRMDQLADNVHGQTVVDPKGYLTDLNSMMPKSSFAIGDIKKARLLVQSMTKSNLKLPSSWIASARIEEIAGKMTAARSIILEGCEMCPGSEDIWLEASRLQTPDLAKGIMTRAVRNVPNSVKVWMRAVDLEDLPVAKKRVLRKALEQIPNSVRLWRSAVELEEPEDARLLLTRAVECCPQSVDLWLALARLSQYEEAQIVLNQAREAVPTERQIWITAAELEETQGNDAMVDKIVERAVKSLAANGVLVNRDQWLLDAENCEQGNHVATAQAIVRYVLGIGIENIDRMDTWLDDADSCTAHGAYACAKAVFAHALQHFPERNAIWLRAAYLEKAHGSSETLEALLQRAVRHCPKAEVLWLMGAKEKWLAGDVQGARQVLSLAFQANPDSEQIWLAAVKLEQENNEHDRARILLRNAREKAGTARVWMKSAKLEWQLAEVEAGKALLLEGLERYPDYDKMWLMAAQIEDRQENKSGARELYAKAVKKCPDSVPLWIGRALLEEANGDYPRARAILESARSKNQKDPLLWLEAVRVERRREAIEAKRAAEQGTSSAAGAGKSSAALMSKAIQECPHSGQLWAQAIFMEPRPARKAKSVDALKACEHDPYVILAVARLFYSERALKKARDWFARAVKLEPELGDAWVLYFNFECQHGTEAQQQDVLQHCIKAEPRYGDLWTSISKDVKNWKLKTADILKTAAAPKGLLHSLLVANS